MTSPVAAQRSFLLLTWDGSGRICKLKLEINNMFYDKNIPFQEIPCNREYQFFDSHWDSNNIQRIVRSEHHLPLPKGVGGLWLKC